MRETATERFHRQVRELNEAITREVAAAVAAQPDPAPIELTRGADGVWRLEETA